MKGNRENSPKSLGRTDLLQTIITKGRMIAYVYIYFCTTTSLLHPGRTYSKQAIRPRLSNTAPNLNFKSSRIRIKKKKSSVSYCLGLSGLIAGFKTSFARCSQLCRHIMGLPRRYGVTSTVRDRVSAAVSMVRRTSSQ